MENKQEHCFARGRRRKHSFYNKYASNSNDKRIQRQQEKEQEQKATKGNRQQNVLKTAKGIIFPFMSFSLSFA